MKLFSKKTLLFFKKEITSNNFIDDSFTKILFLNYKNFIETEFYKNEYKLEYQNRFDRDDKCVALFKDNQIVNISWLCFSDLFIDEIKIKYKVPVNSFVIYDVYTLPIYRNRGFYKLMLNHLNIWGKENNFRYSYIYSELENSISIRAIINSGYKKIEKITFYEFLRMKFYLTKKYD